ncbi:MAG: hypothetical protein M3209_02490 [Acidobacteriota bacterium]|nr:hypothetical protein [Acidobacteriota bacterium]
MGKIVSAERFIKFYFFVSLQENLAKKANSNNNFFFMRNLKACWHGRCRKKAALAGKFQKAVKGFV